MSFTMRTSKPQAGNKFYNNGNNGGYSWCINGYPTDRGCNVLANCVGYACGRFNEIIGSMKYKTLCCNAENFIERAKEAGLEVGMTPKAGAIMCWQYGNTLGGNDGAGHVAIVEKVFDNNHVYTSESNYGSTVFFNAHRYNSNGRWGLGSGYTFRGFIYNPAVVEEEPKDLKFKIGDKVVITGNLYTNSNAESPVNHVSNIVTEITRTNPYGKHPYNTTGDLGWMDEEAVSVYIAPKPEPKELSVGDMVEIVDKGNSQASGNGRDAYGIGWTRYITKIYEGSKYPYQVGHKGKTDGANTIGFYKADALRKL